MDASINVNETASPQSQPRPDPNSRMRALLGKLDPNLDNHHITLKIDDDDYYNYLMEADLYNSAKQDEGHAFLDVLKQVSESKKMSITAIFNSVSLSGDTLLHVAASNGNEKIVELVIHHFHSLLNKENHKGDTAVHVAVKAGEVSVIQVINNKRSEFSKLHSSFYCGLANKRVEWMDESLKLKNKQGNTPLHEALINGHEDLAFKLVEEDESVSFFLNAEDKSAFYLAAEAGYIKCLTLMMERASIEQYRKGKSPIYAAILGKHTELGGALDIMLAKEPGLINSIDEEGRTSLHFAAWMGYNDVVSYLIKKNSRNVMKKDKDGQLPIHLASMMGHIDVIEQLLEQHYNLHELLNENGQNILHVAAESGKYNVVVYILKHHKKLYKQLLNEKDHDGNTPLHLATIRFHPKIVSTLTWDDRADLHATNNKDRTVLDAAKKYYTHGTPTILQRLTWSTLKASGALHFSSGKILLNAGMKSKPPKPPKPPNTDMLPPSAPPGNPKQPNMDNFKDRVNTLLLVSTLIATITFAAGFTMPGGYDDSEPNVGFATMKKLRMFHLFVICDTLAMFTSLAVVVILIWAQLGDISLMGTALHWAVPFLGIALTMMSFAFMAGVYLTVSSLNGLAITILVMAPSLLFVVVILFLPLAFPFTSKYRVFRYITFYFICMVTCIVENS